LTLHFERELDVFRPRPSSLYTFPFTIEQAWLGVVSEEFADFERIPQGVSDPAAQGFYPKSAVSASSTIIPDGLLLIVFDSVGRTHVRDLGILSRVAARATLT
jgi:hypothetical protein